MDRLGTTIGAIAREKAAIIERGDRAVTGATGEALTIIRRRARRVGAPLTEVAPAPIAASDRDGIEVDLPRLGRVRVALRGPHQAANVAVADAILDALADSGIATAGPDARRRGYATAVWPGRMELVTRDGRDVLLDGAHNPAGASALARALDDLRPYLSQGPVTLVTASMADKDVDGIIAGLLESRALTHATVIATSVPMVRALPAAALTERWAVLGAGRVGRIESVADPGEALDLALTRPGPTVVAGSLYLVGAVRARLIDDPELLDPPPIGAP